MRLPTPSTTSLPLLCAALLFSAPLLLPSSDCRGESPQRVPMAPDTLEQADPRNCVSQAAEMATVKNLAGYLECFSARSQKKLRKETALVFTRHDIEIDLLEAHVVKQTSTKCELAVRYRAKLSASQFDVVSLVALKKENGCWKIAGEKPESFQRHSQTISVFGSGCLGGQCPLP